MAEVDVDAVRLIIDTEVSDEAIEDAFIPMADAMMARIQERADDLSVTITDGLDTAMRRLLVAHYISATMDREAGALIETRVDQVYTRVAGGVGTKDMYGAGLKSTNYGNQVIAMDPTGFLDELTSDLPEASIDVAFPFDPSDEVDF